MSGFTVSPHEECAVEEAVRIVERARRQRDRADPRRPRPRRAAAGHAGARRDQRHAAGDRRPRVGADRHRRRHRRRRRARGRGDALRPDPVRQRGRRHRRTTRWASASRTRSDCRASPGSSSSSVTDGQAAGQARGRGRAGDPTSCRCPPCSACKEGINLPRYPSLPGRLRAKRAAIEQRTSRQWQAEGLRKVGLRVPQRGHASGPRCSARSRRGARAGRAAGRAGGAVMTVLCLVEHGDDGAAADASLRALTLARHAGRVGRGGVAAVLLAAGHRRPAPPARWPPSARPRSTPCTAGDGVRPRGLGRGLAELVVVRRRRRRWWRPAPTGAARCWRTWPRSPACRWRPTASRGPVDVARRLRAGPAPLGGQPARGRRAGRPR